MFLKKTINIKKTMLIFILITLIPPIIGYSLETDNYFISSSGTIVIKEPVWNIRSVEAYPYWFPFSSSSYDDLLSDLNNKFGNLINYVTIRYYWAVDPTDPNNQIFYDGDGMNTESELASAINKIHSSGKKVLLGHLGRWHDPARREPNVWPPTNLTLWLQNYKNRCLDLAIFAEANGVESIHIGWEVEYDVDRSLLSGAYNDEWQDILDAVRSVYSGLVSYEANWFTDEARYQEYLNNDWWFNLDYIAFSTYPPLTENELNPTYEQLVSGWTYNPTSTIVGFDLKSHYIGISEYFQKGLVIDIAYSSCDGTNTSPWNTPSSTPDEAEQALCWDVFFDVWNNETAVIGCNIEHFDKPYVTNDITAAFRGKLAETSIRNGLLELIK